MRWNDWAEFEWNIQGRRVRRPCEIWCFVDLSTLPSSSTFRFGDNTLSRGVFAVVESSNPCPNQKPKMVQEKRGKKKTLKPAVDDKGKPVLIPINHSDLFQPILKEVREVASGGSANSSVDGGASFQRKFYLADVEAIVSPCCVIPDIPVGINNSCTSRRYFVVKPRTEWSKEFLRWVAQKHSDDEEAMMEERAP